MAAINIRPLEFHHATALPKPHPHIAYSPSETINNEAVELYRLQDDPQNNRIEVLYRGKLITYADDLKDAEQKASKHYAHILGANFQSSTSDYTEVTKAAGGAFEGLQHLQDAGVDEEALDEIRAQIKTLTQAALQGMVATGTARTHPNNPPNITFDDIDDVIDSMEEAVKPGGMTY